MESVLPCFELSKVARVVTHSCSFKLLLLTSLGLLESYPCRMSISIVPRSFVYCVFHVDTKDSLKPGAQSSLDLRDILVTTILSRLKTIRKIECNEFI